MNNTHPYRSESARQLAERCSHDFNYDTLNININIDAILMKRDPETIKKIVTAVENRTPFILFADDKNYCIIIPKELSVYCYAKGRQQTKESTINIKQFANRVRLAYVSYPGFYEDRSLANREYGIIPVSCGAGGEGVPDDQDISERSEAVLPEQTIRAVQTSIE